MHRAHAILILLFSAACVLRGAEGEFRLLSDHPIYFNPNGTSVATNGITIIYTPADQSGAIAMVADKATINQTSYVAVAEGNVRLERAGEIWQGESLEYNFKRREIVAKNFRSGQAPYYVKGGTVVGEQEPGVYVGLDGMVTTDDYARPAYSIRAKELIIVPGEYIEAHHATLCLGDVPVFYFPYYRRNLGWQPNNFTFVPGVRSLFGPYLLSSYNWYWNERLDGTLHLDARLKRGLAGGPDFRYHLPNFGDGIFKYYYAKDDKPGFDSIGKPIDDDRQRIYFYHFIEPRTNLTIKGIVRYQSDAQVVRDFFESEYRANVQPNSFVEANQLWRNFSLNLEAQPRVNRFFETVERLPDVKLTGFRQQVGQSPLYYESESSVGYFRREFANDLTNAYSATRADTYHQLTLPSTWFGWLNFIPRVGGRYTYYGEADGPGAATAEHYRGVFNTGAELTFKASRVWPAVSSKFWEIDGLRHIIQPSINYVYVPRPTVPPQQLPQFDTVLPTTRLLPIEYPDFNAIDAIDSQNVLRLSLHNKLQTKRTEGVANVVNWALYADWRIHPNSSQTTLSDLYSDLDLQPFSWMVVNSELRYDLNQRSLTEANSSVTFAPNETWSLTLGNRYLRDNAAFGTNYGNNLLFSSIYYRFNENWAFRVSHHFEARDGVMEEQYYTVYHDLRSWTGAVTFRVRENRGGPTDYTVALTMSLKAFPRYGLGEDAVKPELLLGY